ncbi:tenascin-R-like [Dermacentor silvarum]|uniref:tenascin-R-like n=1 Tax=Dermacentor silvarum TaxID=543639 RepID=UPI001899BE98|nr:tenascin-R-like [Dermacentor silvarum]
MHFVGKTVFLTAVFVLFFMTDLSSSRKRRKSQTIKLKAARKTAQMELNITSCRDFECKATCEAQLNQEFVDVIGHCEGASCKCNYKEACITRKCQRLCRQEADRRRVPNANGECQRTNCICTLEDDCDKDKCRKICTAKYPGRPSSARGICIDGECTCRHL